MVEAIIQVFLQEGLRDCYIYTSKFALPVRERQHPQYLVSHKVRLHNRYTVLLARETIETGTCIITNS